MVLFFEGVFHEKQFAVLKTTGSDVATGLNEFAPEIKLIEENETNVTAAIKQIHLT
jgi:hypothetical protein